MANTQHHPLRAKLKNLYDGRSQRARRFRYGLLILDLVIIGYFLVVSMVETPRWLIAVDYVVAVIMLADYTARLWITNRRLRYVLQPVSLADAAVIVSLLLPVITDNFAFLRVMRALRLVRSYHMIHDLRARYQFFARNEEVIHGTLNLVVFIFFVTALVYVLQVHINPDIKNYVDALYFTVATLTTTGFGDITLHGSTGKLLAIVIMVFGVALFLRLVQAIFRTHKVEHKCPQCGLNRHDPDAIHCKHCGLILNIETEGE